MKQFRHSILNEQSLDGGYRAIPEEPLDLEETFQAVKKIHSSNTLEIVSCIRPLFFCFRNPSSSDMICMQLIARAMQSDLLTYRLEFLSTPPNVEHVAITGTPGRGRGRVSESGEHKGMKSWVRAHLTSRGVRAVIDEVSYLGYRVDVGSLLDKVFVECGDTEPRKVFEFLRHEIIMGILQYNAEDIAWLIPSPGFCAFAEAEWMNLI